MSSRKQKTLSAFGFKNKMSEMNGDIEVQIPDVSPNQGGAPSCDGSDFDYIEEDIDGVDVFFTWNYLVALSPYECILVL